MKAAKSWAKKLAPYREASNGRAVFEILVTAAPFLALWVASWLLYRYQRLGLTGTFHSHGGFSGAAVHAAA